MGRMPIILTGLCAALLLVGCNANKASSHSVAGQSNTNQDMFANAPVPGPATSTQSSVQPVKPLQPLPPVTQAADPNPIATTDVIRAEPILGRRHHVVQPGDTLWSLANRYYSKPQRWRDILAANPGLQERRLAIGSTVVVP